MRRSLPTLLALAALALPAAGQDDRMTKTAEVYRVEAWPAPGPARAGVTPTSLTVPGWTQRAYEVDPRRGEGAVRLADANGAEVVVAARVLGSAGEARKALLRELAAGQRVLAPVAGVGEVAFGGGGESLTLLFAVRGNVLMELRAVTRQEALGREALVELAMALDRLVQAARPIEPGEPVGPRLLGVRAGPGRAGEPVALELDVDPAGAPVAHVVFECSDGAAVVETDRGFELLAAEPGKVEVVVRAMSKDLRVATIRAVVEVH